MCNTTQAYQFVSQMVPKKEIVEIEYSLTRIILMDFGNKYEIELEVKDI